MEAEKEPAPAREGPRANRQDRPYEAEGGNVAGSVAKVSDALPPKAPPSLAINNFVGQYYQTSTFHHLSTWKARLQEFTSSVASGQARPDASLNLQVAGASSTKKESSEESPVASQASQSSSPEEGGDRRPTGNSAVTSGNGAAMNNQGVAGRQVLAHVDMDAFYVSVAIRDNPALVGRPVVVCPSTNVNGTSEVSTCSYAARRYGIKPRMFVRDARALCPELICLPCDYEKYEKVSQQIYQIFLKYSNRVQAVSADEAFLDVSVYDDPEDAVAKLRREIYDQTGCPASAGLSHNLLLARLATEKAKPAGQFYLKADMVEEFLQPLNVDKLPGVGPSLADKLHQRGICTVGDLRCFTQDWLEKEMGKKKGQMLWKYARGIDDRSFQPVHARKSIGTQLSWGIRFVEKDQVKGFLNDVSKEVAKRMREAKVKGMRINLKIKRKKPGGNESEKVFNPGEIVEVCRSRSILFFTDEWEVIAKEALTLFISMLIPPSEVRGVGLYVDKLDTDESDSTKSKAQSGMVALDRFFSKREKMDTSTTTSASTRAEDKNTDEFALEEVKDGAKNAGEDEDEGEAEAEAEVADGATCGGRKETAVTTSSTSPSKRKSLDDQEEAAEKVARSTAAQDRMTTPAKRSKTAAASPKPPTKSPGRKPNKALGGNVSPGKQMTLAQMFGRQPSPS